MERWVVMNIMRAEWCWPLGGFDRIGIWKTDGVECVWRWVVVLIYWEMERWYCMLIGSWLGAVEGIGSWVVLLEAGV